MKKRTRSLTPALALATLTALAIAWPTAGSARDPISANIAHMNGIVQMNGIAHMGSIIQMSGTMVPTARSRDHRSPERRVRRVDHRRISHVDHRSRERVGHSDRRVDHRTVQRSSRRAATGRTAFGPSASVLARPGLSRDSSCSCWDGIGSCKKSGGQCVKSGGDLGCTGVCAVEDPDGFSRSAR